MRPSAWADRYDEQHRKYPLYAELLEAVVRLAEPRADDAVLDLGTGTGAVVLRLAPQVRHIVGADPDPDMLGVASGKGAEAGIANAEWVQGGLLDWESSHGPFTLITSNLALHHLRLDEKAQALRRMHDALADTGRIVIGDIVLFDDYDPEMMDVDTYEHVIRETAEGAEDGDFVERADDLMVAFARAALTVSDVAKVHCGLGALRAASRP